MNGDKTLNVPGAGVGATEVVHVFLSSTWEDLQAERRAVEAVLQRFRETKFVGMEFFGSRAEDTRNASLDEVDRCSLYIGLVGGRYGSGITEAEYRRARANGMPCLIYVKSSPRHLDDELERAQDLAEFLAQLKQSHTVTPFGSADELAAKVATDLHRWLFDDYVRPRLQQALTSQNERAVQPLVSSVLDQRDLDPALRTKLQRAGYTIQVPPTASFDARPLQLVANQVRQVWIKGVLARAVPADLQIQLDKEGEPETIDRPWSRLVEVVDNGVVSEQSTDDAILKIFADAARFLLVLGEPGSGKSMTLLELTRDLLDLYDARVEPYVPVVLNLASWRPSSTNFLAWAVEELRTVYFVPRETARAWLQGQALYLILDGLDEVPTGARDSCVDALNTYLQQVGAPGVAMSCRIEEYRALTRRVQLHGAIRIAPLTDDQIDQYVGRLGPTSEALRVLLKTDTELRQLARSPFMLSVMSAALRTGSADSRTTELTRVSLFGMYVSRMFRRRGVSEPVEANVTAELSWLAARMRRHSCSIFTLERLQPSWLESFAAIALYASLTSIATFGALVVCSLAFLVTVPFSPPLVTGVVAFMAGTASVDLLRLMFLPADLRPWWHRTLVAGFLIAYWVVPVGCLALVLEDWTDLPFIASTVVTVFWITYGWRMSWRHRDSDIRMADDVRWSWRRSATGALIAVVVLTVLSEAGEASFALFSSPTFASVAEDMLEWLSTAFSNPRDFAADFIRVESLPALAIGGILGGFRSSVTGRAARPYQSIFSTARRSVLFGLCVGLLVVLMLSVTDPGDLSNDVTWRILLILVGIGMLGFGGLDLIRHGVLRLVLRLSGRWPMMCVRLLDRATTLALVRRVGSGYVFIHRMLLDYFADRATAQVRQGVR